MQINDDTIRSAFAWPVMFDEVAHGIVDMDGRGLCHILPLKVADQLGREIAAMLNERYAPKKERPKMETRCAICGRRYGLHCQGQGECPDDDNDSGWHPTNRYTPIGGSDARIDSV